MSFQKNCSNNTATAVSAETKCEFANLKYEQLLSEKYFIETCFSKKYESYTSKQKLIDLFLEIKLDDK